jgi:Cu+-exporting ATPase
MTCAACSGRIERQLNKLAGVEAVVNLAAEKAHIRYAPQMIDQARLIATIEKTGFGATLSTADTHEEEKARKAAAYREELRRFWISLALTLPLIGQMIFMFSGAWDATRTCCRAGCSSCSPRPFSSGSAAASTSVAGTR